MARPTRKNGAAEHHSFIGGRPGTRRHRMEKTVDAAVSASGARVGSAPVSATHGAGVRWAQLVMGIICMAMIANLQYGWTLFVNPIADKFHWTKASIQVAFTIFVLTETWLVPVEGW